ncbi:MAG: hypothetical protein C4547_06700 [Phycisphaerales bacterium]|nr:MAG: hypothetical protein C4547_06700 [Phycisphaerales bacterium]
MPEIDPARSDEEDGFAADDALAEDDSLVVDDDAEVLPCPSCGADVYEDADQCPICGQWITPGASGRRQRWIAAVVILMVALLIVLTIL